MEIIIKNGKKAFGDNVIFENINMKFEKGKFYLIKVIMDVVKRYY